MTIVLRRLLTPAAASALLLTLLVPTGPSAGAAVPGCAWDPELPDSQANDAYFAIGQPAGTATDNHDGRVRLLLSQEGTQTVVRQPAAERRPSGQFGAAAALADLNDDSCADVVIGAPGGQGRTGADAAGAVYVLLGQMQGVSTDTGLRLAPPAAQAGAQFGSALAVGTEGFVERPRTSVWVGAPGLDVNGVKDAGGVYHYEFDAAGVPRFVQVVTLATRGVPGSPRAGDRFGEVLAPAWQYSGSTSRMSVLVGVPRADGSGKRNSGAVTLLQPNAAGLVSLAQTWTQDSRGVPGRAETGDQFGAAVTEDAVGVPGEDLGKRKDAGMVQLFTLGRLGQGLTPKGSYTQSTRRIPGTAESGDRFGASLAEGTFFCQEQWDLAVGVPGEDLGRVRDAGTVTLISIPPSDSPCKPRLVRQGRDPLRRDVAESGDLFGSTLAALPGIGEDEDFFHGLAVGAQGEDFTAKPEAGIVHGLNLSFDQPGQAWSLPGPARSARYGQVLGIQAATS